MVSTEGHPFGVLFYYAHLPSCRVIPSDIGLFKKTGNNMQEFTSFCRMYRAKGDVFMNGHQISIELESIARRVLKTERGGYGHVAHADYIDIQGGAFHVIISVLAPCYKNATEEERAKIDEFIEKYRDLSDKKVGEEFDLVRTMTDELKQLTRELY